MEGHMEANFKYSITRKRWLGSLISLRKGEVFHNSKISFRIDSSEVPRSFKFVFFLYHLIYLALPLPRWRVCTVQVSA